MENLGRIIKSPEARRYVYTVIIAAIPLLVAYGIVNESDIDNITVFVGAILGFGTTVLAVANTPHAVDKPVETPHYEELDSVNDIESQVVELEEQGLLSEEESVAKDAMNEITEVKELLSEILETLYLQDELKGE